MCVGLNVIGQRVAQREGISTDWGTLRGGGCIYFMVYLPGEKSCLKESND